MKPEETENAGECPLTRRNFVRKSALATGAISVAGLIRAHGEGGGGGQETTIATTHDTTIVTTDETTIITTDETTIVTTEETTEMKYVWWKIFSFEVSTPVNVSHADVENAPGDTLQEKQENAAYKRFCEATTGEPEHVEKQPGGTELNPHKYEKDQGEITWEDDDVEGSNGGTATVSVLLKVKYTLRE